MQTFITDHDMDKNAKNLDYRRLGKQRVEALQIAEILILNRASSWSRHPAVKMWKGYEAFLMKVYIPAIMKEWMERGYANAKCASKHFELMKLVRHKSVVVPSWLNDSFICSHRSNLVRKNPEIYGKLFPEVDDSLEYIWPMN